MAQSWTSVQFGGRLRILLGDCRSRGANNLRATLRVCKRCNACGNRLGTARWSEAGKNDRSNAGI